MISVGITGGIGSGKTTVANVWNSLGARVIFADDLAKELMQTDERLIQRLKETFGTDSYNADGSLNKPHLIEEAFQNNRVEELNAVVHPAIRRETKKLIQKAEEDGVQMLAYEAAILLNEGRPDYLDVVVLVTSDKKTRLNRVAKRDQANEGEVLARMAKQPDFSSLTHLVDHVIKNDGTLDELKSKSTRLYNNLIGKT